MTVHFIGAGPGAPDLITLRGLRLIRRCPVVLYAGSLVPAEVVAEAGDEAPVPPQVIDTAALDLDAIIAEIEAAASPAPGRRPGAFGRPVVLRRDRRADAPPPDARDRLPGDPRRAGLRGRRGGARARS